MTLDDAIHALGNAGRDLPRAAMRWSLDHWDEAGPAFVALLDAYGRGVDRSEQTQNALFFMIHLLGEKHETAAFGPFCRLLMEGETADLILGDGIFSTMPGVLINTYTDDPAPLVAVVEATQAEDYVRYGALMAMAYVTRTGRLPEAVMRAHLIRWRADLQPRSDNPIWIAWAMAVAHLGYADMGDDAVALVRDGFVPDYYLHESDVRDALARAVADPTTLEGFVNDHVGPSGDAIEELARWHSFATGDKPVPRVRRGLGASAPQATVINPLRHVGRNDPCPCGSGKKFKKCCLGLPASALAVADGEPKPSSRP